VKNKPILQDGYFDEFEKYSYTLARNLGFRADKVLGPEENEKHHIHWMVGFSRNNYYWEKTKQKYNL